MANFFKHLVVILKYSIMTMIFYFIVTGIGWSGVFGKNEFVANFFGTFTYILSVPFLWIKPGSAFDNGILFILLPLFWGIIFYMLSNFYKQIKK